MLIGIDLLIDFAAQRLLGSPEHSRITLHFLNAALAFKNRIVDVIILNPINIKAFDADKLSILDIKAIDSIGRRFNIEVQTTRPLGLAERLTYYAARQLHEQLGEGDQYADLNPSISICVLNAIMFRHEASLQHAFQLRTAGGLSLTDCLQVHIFELPKYVIPSDNKPIVDPVEQWLYFFRESPKLTAEELAYRLPDPVFSEAIGVLQMIAKNPEERQLYEDRLKAERDEWARTAQAEKDGLERGREEGFEQGRQEGRQEGEIIGKIELLCQLLNQPYLGERPLREQSIDELASLEADLQRRLRKRT